MPGPNPTEEVQKLLAEQMAVEDRRKTLIDQLLRMKAETCKVFDDQLAMLGYNTDKKPKRSHHKKPTSAQKAKA